MLPDVRFISSMADPSPTYLNTGIYSVPEASRLTRVSTGRIRRWLKGYRFYSGAKPHHSPALWNGQLQPIEDRWALGFLDLVEIKCVDSFVKTGVSWTMLRKAHSIGIKMFNVPHPFCTQRFATDGRDIFAELHEKTGEESLIEIVNQQKVFKGIIAPFFKELEFDGEDILARWRPLTKRRLVVLDPARSFGHPIVANFGVPTEFIAKAAERNSIMEVSKWYELPENEIRDAIEFEKKLAA
jgi:uncharacterized protein (DUF433 family)